MKSRDTLLNRATVEAVAELAERAGQAILEVYGRPDFGTQIKADDSPLTEADLAAHDVLVDGLAELTPDVPVLSEESTRVSADQRRQWDRYWLVDPLDGTKEFIKRNDEFTVNIALIWADQSGQGRPVMGIVHAPVLSATYWAAEGLGAFKRRAGSTDPIRVADEICGPVTVVVSRSHIRQRDQAYIDELRNQYGDVDLSPTGSSLKLCLVAEGSADVYPRFGPTMEWDIGAAHCVVEQAGGRIVTDQGGALVYNKPDLVNPFFVASTPALDLQD